MSEVIPTNKQFNELNRIPCMYVCMYGYITVQAIQILNFFLRIKLLHSTFYMQLTTTLWLACYVHFTETTYLSRLGVCIAS